MKEIVEKLKEFFSVKVFHAKLHGLGEKDFKISNFYIRFEKYTHDIILYIEPVIDGKEVLDLEMKNRNEIERLVDHSLSFKSDQYIAQVIVPSYEFWKMLEEGTDTFDKELFSFVYEKTKNLKYKIHELKHQIVFSIRPYVITGGKLIFDVGDFYIKDQNGKKKENMDFREFRSFIEEKVLKSLIHLGVKKVQLALPGERLTTINEEKLKFIKNKVFSNYLTPYGTLSFELESSINEGKIHCMIKNVELIDESEKIELNEEIRKHILSIAENSIQKYGFWNQKIIL